MYLHKLCWENTRETGLAGQFWGEQRGWQLGAERRFLFFNYIFVCLSPCGKCMCVQVPEESRSGSYRMES